MDVSVDNGGDVMGEFCDVELNGYGMERLRGLGVGENEMFGDCSSCSLMCSVRWLGGVGLNEKIYSH